MAQIPGCPSCKSARTCLRNTKGTTILPLHRRIPFSNDSDSLFSQYVVNSGEIFDLSTGHPHKICRVLMVKDLIYCFDLKIITIFFLLIILLLELLITTWWVSIDYFIVGRQTQMCEMCRIGVLSCFICFFCSVTGHLALSIMCHYDHHSSCTYHTSWSHL